MLEQLKLVKTNDKIAISTSYHDVTKSQSIILTVNIELMFLAGFVGRILDLIAGQALHLLPVHALVDLHQLHGGGLVPGVLVLHFVILQDVINVPFEVDLLRVGFSSAGYLHIVTSLDLGGL